MRCSASSEANAPRGSVTHASQERAQRLAPILLAVGVGLAAFAWLNHVNPSFLASDDGIRDQLLMRDCTELGRCHLIGAPTSLPGLHQGAVWLDLLIAVRLLGGDAASQRTVVLVLLALSVAVLFVVVWRWLRASLALPAAVLLGGALSLDIYPSQLINPSVSAFPDVLTAAGLLCYGLAGQRRFLLLSAFALGVGINVHVGSSSLVAPLLAIAVLARPRSWRALLASIAVLMATYFITSSAALRANVIGLATYGLLLPALAGAAAVVLVCTGLGSRFRRLSWDTRAWIMGVIMILPFSLASLWLVIWENHHFGITYLHPILAPAAVLTAALVCLPFELGARRRRALRWIPTAAAAGAIAMVAIDVSKHTAVVTSSPSNSWSLAEAAAIADQATRRGWTYEDLMFRIQGSACRELLTAMSVAAPPPHSPLRSSRRQLQVVKVPRDAQAVFADTNDIVPLGPTTVAVLRGIESWLQPESLQACRVPVDSGRAPRCSSATPRASGALAVERFLFISRSYPEIHSLDLLPPYVATYVIPLAPAAGETHDLAVIDDAVAGCGWRITRAEGVQVEGSLPARRVRLHSDAGGPGLLVIEKPFGTAACAPDEPDRRYPPCVFEAPPGDPLQVPVAAG